MARPLRFQDAGLWYHVTNRGNNREDVFLDDEDCQRFLDVLGNSAALFGVEEHACVIMSNHMPRVRLHAGCEPGQVHAACAGKDHTGGSAAGRAVAVGAAQPRAVERAGDWRRHHARDAADGGEAAEEHDVPSVCRRAPKKSIFKS